MDAMAGRIWMTKIDWDKADQHVPDPGKVREVREAECGPVTTDILLKQKANGQRDMPRSERRDRRSAKRRRSLS